MADASIGCNFLLIGLLNNPTRSFSVRGNGCTRRTRERERERCALALSLASANGDAYIPRVAGGCAATARCKHLAMKYERRCSRGTDG